MYVVMLMECSLKQFTLKDDGLLNFPIVEPLSKGLFGNNHSVHCREGVLFSEVLKCIITMGIGYYEMSFESEVVSFLEGVSFIRGSTVCHYYYYCMSRGCRYLHTNDIIHCDQIAKKIFHDDNVLTRLGLGQLCWHSFWNNRQSFLHEHN